jgi:hypothetical protein
MGTETEIEVQTPVEPTGIRIEREKEREKKREKEIKKEIATETRTRIVTEEAKRIEKTGSDLGPDLR